MNGLELAKAYFEEYGAPMLHEAFPAWEGRIAAGLIGSGSECFGFDDEISRDHDFEVGFCLFIPGENEMDRQTAFRLERAYAKLPKEFRGFGKSLIDPVGGSRHGVIRVPDFFTEKLGRPDADLNAADWLRIPESSLFELSRGTVFRDDERLVLRELEKIRRFPEDIRLKKLAGELLMMAQAGQYNYSRCLKRGDTAAAQLCVTEFTKAAIHTVFLLNRAYLPYYKWQFRAMKELPLFAELADPFEYLLTSKNAPAEAEEKQTLIEDLAGVFIAELMEQGITKASCGDLEKHAYSVNDHIGDAALRNLHILAAL
ncbi:MAG: DUF4037 domain-containing protein [Lachnospiraceae bacterium]|nr:DUF4037 domain-containing protein [Lachnospiraceae bacterium]